MELPGLWVSLLHKSLSYLRGIWIKFTVSIRKINSLPIKFTNDINSSNGNKQENSEDSETGLPSIKAEGNDYAALNNIVVDMHKCESNRKPRRLD